MPWRVHVKGPTTTYSEQLQLHFLFLSLACTLPREREREGGRERERERKREREDKSGANFSGVTLEGRDAWMRKRQASHGREGGRGAVWTLRLSPSQQSSAKRDLAHIWQTSSVCVVRVRGLTMCVGVVLVHVAMEEPARSSRTLQSLEQGSARTSFMFMVSVSDT